MRGADVREWQLRERISSVLEQVGSSDLEVALEAAALLADLRSVWVRERRWRNSEAPPAIPVHVAGPVIDCREYRRSCPGYIVDRRQTCQTCGEELVRGRWACYFDTDSQVAQLGTIMYPASGHARETPCC